MPFAETLTVPGTPAGLREALLFFEQFGEAHDVPRGSRWRVRLALDEILSNVIRFAHDSADNAVDMTFRFDAGVGVLSVEIVDAADAFNPLLAPRPDTTSPLRDREPGGLGLLLVRRLMDETLYERRGDCNHLLLKCGPDHAHR
jgi:serine/threonine-protein kinase RsbW